MNSLRLRFFMTVVPPECRQLMTVPPQAQISDRDGEDLLLPSSLLPELGRVVGEHLRESHGRG